MSATQANIVACDVDLYSFHAWSTRDGRICSGASDWPWDPLSNHDIVLVEVSTSVIYGDSAAANNKRRWALHNAYALGRLSAWIGGRLAPKILVSPSTVWTKKLKESVREVIVGCQGQDNHHIRACRCMVHFYLSDSRLWSPLPDMRY